MRPPSRRRTALSTALCALFLASCGREKTSPTPGPAPASPGGERTEVRPVERDEVPPGEVEVVSAALYEGLGLMEQYKYGEAAERFREVRRRAPGWTPGRINLAIALLNKGGVASAEAKEAGGGEAGKSAFDEALDLLGDVIGRDPKNPHARYCRGIILENLGRFAEANADFLVVTEVDPADGHAWLHLGSTLTDPDDPEQPAGPKQAARQIDIYKRALEANPYLVPALYRLVSAYRLARQPEKVRDALDLFNRLNPQQNVAAPGDMADSAYGVMGRYAEVVNPLVPRVATAKAGPPPRFGAPKVPGIALLEGTRWAGGDDFGGPLAVLGRARARFGAAVASLDADGDGKTDLYLAGALVGPKGVRDALLLNRGDGRFEDGSTAFGLPEDRASLGVAAGDFDGDRRNDLFLTGPGGNRLLRNEGRRFEDVTEKAGLVVGGALGLTARWLDLDQDGDLDLYIVNYTDKDHADAAFGDDTTPGIANAAFRNDGVPSSSGGGGSSKGGTDPPALATDESRAGGPLSIAFTPWPEAGDLLGGDAPHTGLAALDVDGDRDLDLVLPADGEAPRVVLNDRLGRFHAAEDAKIPRPEGPTAGMLVADLDKDGLADLFVPSPGGAVAAWLNRSGRVGMGRITFDERLAGAIHWRSAAAADIDLDGSIDLVGLPTKEPGLAWAHNQGDHWQSGPLALPSEALADRPTRGFAVADLVGDPLPDLLLLTDDGPRLAEALGNGQHWLALDLGGRWRIGKEDRMRTNSHALGAWVVLEGRGLNVPYVHTTPASGPAQSVGPIVLGLGSSDKVPLLSVRWPDGVLQGELNVPADQLLALAENNRRPSSCPVLFAWDGGRLACVTDFLGGGGLGYLVAPGRYSRPDRDEAVLIEPGRLVPKEGRYLLAVAEPMDEVCYLDQLALEVVDLPPGFEVAPDERFAPGGNRPTGDLIAWKTAIEPVHATDLEGRDVTEALLARDRRTVDRFGRLGWIGYAEEHGIVLDFGDRLSRFRPTDRLVLVLDGWVEYPYSQTNYAAATAGVALRPPVLERLRDDGTWKVIEPDPGYPAGLPRRTTLDLTGKLTGPRCAIRLRTNMEIDWDRAFVAVPESAASVRVTRLAVDRAVLGYRGYLREVSPDGRPPLLYDYDHIDPAPLTGLAGRLTRYGDVAPLLRADDDRLCLVGPGDEVRLEFDADGAPELPEGWTRAFVLRSVGYCKDADPFTAASDTVEPMPWKGMGDYPFGPEGRRPEDPAYRTYLETYQTRRSGR